MVDDTGDRAIRDPEQNWLLKRLDPDVLESFSPEQKKALEAAAGEKQWREHALDLRLSVPTPGGGRYLTLVGGREKRLPERRKQDRREAPFLTISNIFFFFGLVTLTLLVVFFGVLFYSALIEF